ncbi:MAG: ATP-binding protein [Myxococcota bacterium]
MSVGFARTIRSYYRAGLLLVALAATVAFAGLYAGLADQDRYAGLINTSGRQRMLSQRVVLLASRLQLSGQGESELANAIAEFQSNHETVVSWVRERPGSPVHQVYFGAPHFVDRVANEFVSNCLHFLAQSGLERDRSFDRLLSQAVRGDFLKRLNSAVASLQNNAEVRIGWLKTGEFVVLLVTWTLLLLEARFIFRPMVNTAVDSMEQLRRSETELKRTNEELTQFNYRVSHDLVAPLRTLLGQTSVAKLKFEQDPTLTRDMLDGMAKQAQSLTELISRVSDVARADVRDGTYENVSLEAVARDLLDVHAKAIDEAGIEVSLSLEQEHVETSPQRMRQILDNLLSNAIKYYDPNKNERRISIRSRKESDSLVLEVSDNGVGIDPSMSSDIFDIFVRGCSERGGNGLGLYLVRKHAERLDGSARVASPANDTVLQVSLPMEVAS